MKKKSRINKHIQEFIIIVIIFTAIIFIIFCHDALYKSHVMNVMNSTDYKHKATLLLNIAFMFLAIVECIFSASTAPSKASAGWMDLRWDFSGSETDLSTTGTIPPWLNGSLYRNGGGYFRHMTVDMAHWFGGLGFVRAYHFDGSQNVSFYCSFINSSLYNQYHPYSNYKSKKLNSPNSQVTIRKVNGNILANADMPLSNSIDPITTRTVYRPYIYDDEYVENPMYNQACPSHSQTSPDGEVFHFLYILSPNVTNNVGYYQLYHIPPNTNSRIMAPNKILPNQNYNQPLFQHMHGLTEHYVILCEVPFSIIDGLWMPSLGVNWKVVDKYSAELIATFPSSEPDVFNFYHFANSYEYIDEETGELNIVVDIIINANGTIFDALYINHMIYNWTWSMDMFCTGHLVRFVLPINQTGTHVSPTQINPNFGVEMPVIWYEKYNTKPYRYVYQVSVKNCGDKHEDRSQFWDALMKTTVTFDGSGDTIIWSAPNIFVTEPIFVANLDARNEDDGVLLAEALDSTTNSSFLLILDAHDMKEIARVKPSVIKTIPFGFHGKFYSK
eukprot:18762_1